MVPSIDKYRFFLLYFFSWTFSYALINQNRIIWLSNLHQWGHLSSLNPYEGCFSCYVDTPFPSPYRQLSIGFPLSWISSFYGESDQINSHFINILWQVDIYLLLYTNPYITQYWDVLDHSIFIIPLRNLTDFDVCLF